MVDYAFNTRVFRKADSAKSVLFGVERLSGSEVEEREDSELVERKHGVVM
jgi:hypothetical protein